MSGNFSKNVYRFLEVISGYAFFSNLKPGKRLTVRLLIISAIAVALISLSIIFDRVIPFVVQLPIWIIGGLFLLGMVSWIVIVRDRHLIRNYFILFSMIVLSLIIKKLHWPGAGVLLVLSLSIMAAGFFIYSIKLFFTIQDNLYLKLIGTVACIVIMLSSLGLLFKYQHWPGAGILTYSSLTPYLLITLIVLLTLPSSGYIKWPKIQRLILTRRLLIPWLFLLAFIAVKTLLPLDIQKQLFEKDSAEIAPFEMREYELPDAEGLERGQ